MSHIQHQAKSLINSDVWNWHLWSNYIVIKLMIWILVARKLFLKTIYEQIVFFLGIG